jgi:imidazolonepropionase-like amidohydrolase
VALALVNACLVDGTGLPARNGVAVTVENGRIAGVGEAPPDGAETLDVEGRTILPGLVDAHVHLSSLDVEAPVDAEEYALADAARRMVEAGITTVRDLGSYGRSLFRLRDAIRLGLCPGPRLVLCGRVIAATCQGALAFPGMYREADGAVELRKAVREQLREGADLVKVMVTGALTVAAEDVEPAQLTREELDAVVAESHRLGYMVAAHAEGLDGIRLSVEAGVDTLEHGERSFRAPEVLAAMAERGIILVPTLSVFAFVAESDRFPAWMRERAKELGESAHKTVQAARREGVALAMGADAPPHGANARELVRLVDAGLSPMEGIVAATRAAARASGLEHEIGTVEAGKVADLLVVDGDPLADIRVLCNPDRIRLVFQAGRVVVKRV